MRFWSPPRAGRPDAGRHQHHAGPGDGAQVRRLLGRADQAVDADVARLRGALGDQLGTVKS